MAGPWPTGYGPRYMGESGGSAARHAQTQVQFKLDVRPWAAHSAFLQLAVLMSKSRHDDPDIHWTGATRMK